MKALNALTLQHFVADHLIWLTSIPPTSHFPFPETTTIQCAYSSLDGTLISLCAKDMGFLAPIVLQWIDWTLQDLKEYRKLKRKKTFLNIFHSKLPAALSFHLFRNCFKYHWKHICSYRGAFNFTKMTERQFPIELDYSN